MAANWVKQLMGPDPAIAGNVVYHGSKGGGGSGINADKILEQMQKSYESANKAGEEQYADLMGLMGELQSDLFGEGGTYPQAFSEISKLGGTAAEDIGRREQKALAQSEQDLMSRGLGNTTIRETARRGVRSDAERARQSLMEKLAGQRAGLLTQMGGAQMNLGHLTGDYMLSKDIGFPDMGAYTGLLQQLAAAGGGGGMPSFSGGGGAGGSSSPGGIPGVGSGGSWMAAQDDPVQKFGADSVWDDLSGWELIADDETYNPNPTDQGPSGPPCGYIKKPGCILEDGTKFYPKWPQQNKAIAGVTA